MLAVLCRLTRPLFGIVLALAIAHWATRYPQVGHFGFAGIELGTWFDLDGERNVPAAFSTFLFAFSAVLSAILGLRAARVDLSSGRRMIGMAAVLSILGADEWLSWHERFSWKIERWAAQGPEAVRVYLPAIVLTIAIVLGAIFLRRWSRTVPAPIGSRVRWGALLFFGGAIGIELVSQWLMSGTTVCAALMTLEEILEMSGLIVLAGGLTLECARYEPVEALAS